MIKKFLIISGVILLGASCNAPQALRNPSAKAPVAVPAQPAASSQASATGTSVNINSQIYTVGQVSRHAANFYGRTVRIHGYILQSYPTYAIFSDEPTGPVGFYDLPVAGPGVADLQTGHKYLLSGMLLNNGFAASNHNPNHLELSSLPIAE